MKERKYIKLRTDMYADTKFKIIDIKPERDMIHYVWTRFVTLAGKVNMEGDLYMSRNLPYTIETLALEFNRSEEQIKLALDVFIELEMMELIDGKIYRVKNFAKHQNIKVKEKTNSKDNVIVEPKNKEEIVKEVTNQETTLLKTNIEDREKIEKEASKRDNYINEAEKVDNEDRKSEIEVDEDGVSSIKKDYGEYQVIYYSGINEEDIINSEIVEPKLKESIPIPIESEKNNKKRGKKKRKDVINVTDEDNGDEIISFTDGERQLGEGERILFEMTF
ncbi:phage replisome organizer N-terminal domain-containing protein [Clostridium sp. C2-6-12]|uniref:phage replisome organizer N-terminal domain-containing protein n=1 Tax=Clostridium sp. C2-6-12 TaxID=2698832 RepID=UPI001371DCB0|nr:phage replisome organizer N-terminal domain-containing protein [Clostridium sp. C2-6-12]